MCEVVGDVWIVGVVGVSLLIIFIGIDLNVGCRCGCCVYLVFSF